MASLQIVGALETSRGVSLAVEIPFEAHVVPRDMRDSMWLQLKTSFLAVAEHMKKIPLKELEPDIRRLYAPMADTFQKLASLFEETNRLSTQTTQLVRELCTTATDGIPRMRPNRRSDGQELSKWQTEAIPVFRKCRAVADEFSDLENRDKPTTVKLTFFFAGDSADVEKLGAALRQKALSIVREAQQENADEHRWSTVKGQNGSPTLYRPPLGTELKPIVPMVDVDSPEETKAIVHTLHQSVETSERPSISMGSGSMGLGDLGLLGDFGFGSSIEIL